MLQADGNQKRAGGSYIYIRQNGCESKSVTRDNESHSIMIKESLYQKDIAIVIMYVLKMWAPTYMKQINRSADRNRCLCTNSGGLKLLHF